MFEQRKIVSPKICAGTKFLSREKEHPKKDFSQEELYTLLIFPEIFHEQYFLEKSKNKFCWQYKFLTTILYVDNKSSGLQ